MPFGNSIQELGGPRSLDYDEAGDLKLLCLIGATNVEVAVSASASAAECHAQRHDKRDGLFLHTHGWVCRSDGYREWADRGL